MKVCNLIYLPRPLLTKPGLDGTHNPEFTTCEFYKSYTDLEELVSMTEAFLSGLARQVQYLKEEQLTSLPFTSTDFSAPFNRIEFIPTIEEAIGCKIPNLSAPDAESQLLSIFKELSILPPSSVTLPRLLDRLSSLYIEPHCNSPTFIIHHPECLSPLSKSFYHTEQHQRVSARVELFINGREL